MRRLQAAASKMLLKTGGSSSARQPINLAAAISARRTTLRAPGRAPTPPRPSVRSSVSEGAAKGGAHGPTRHMAATAPRPRMPAASAPQTSPSPARRRMRRRPVVGELQRRLTRQTKSIDDVLRIVESSRDQMDPLNRVTALHRIAKLAPRLASSGKSNVGNFLMSDGPGPGDTAGDALSGGLWRKQKSSRRAVRVPTFADTRIQALLSSMERDAASYSRRAVATVIYSLGRLYERQPCDHALLAAVLDRLSVVFSLSSARARPRQADHAFEQATSMAMWGLAVIDNAASVEAMDRVAQRLLHEPLEQCGPVVLATVAWALSTKGVDARPVLDAIADAVCNRLHQFEPQGLSMLAWAFARAGNGSPVLFAALEAELLQRDLDQFSIRSISNLTFAFTEAGHEVPELAARLSAHARDNLQRASIDDIYHFLNTLTKASSTNLSGSTFSSSMLTTLAQVVNDRAPLFTNRELCSAIVSFSSAGLSIRDADVSETLYRTLASEAERRLSSLEESEVAILAYSFARASFVATPLLDDIAERSTDNIGEFSPRSLACLAWSFGAVGHYSAPAMDAIAQAARAKMDQLAPYDLTMLLTSYAKLAHPAPELFKDVASRFVAQAPELDESTLTMIAWAYGVMELWSPSIAEVVLTELGRRDVSRFHQHSWMQIYQFEKSFPEIAPQLRVIREEALKGWSLPLPSNSSAFHQDVSRTLHRMGISHTTEHVSDDRLSVIDIALDTPDDSTSRLVAIEVDGPNHFCSNVPRRELGRTIAKRRLLEKTGWRVVQIPYWEWGANDDYSAKASYLAAKLRQGSAGTAHFVGSDFDGQSIDDWNGGSDQVRVGEGGAPGEENEEGGRGTPNGWFGWLRTLW